MNVIIHNATIINPKGSHHNQRKSIRITDGIIDKIENSISSESGYQELSFPNLMISPGWMDSSVSFGEPGFEERETIENGLLVAAKSGFTAVALNPETNPIIDNQAGIKFVKQKAQNSLTELFPIGALTTKSEGNNLAELFDMKNAGAIAFTDYKKNIANANLLKIALQYCQDFDGMVISFCQDPKITGNGVVHEGIASTQLGLKGIPPLAEAIEVAKNLYILEYTGGKLHIPTISTIESIEQIRIAKQKGLNVTCSVSVHHLSLTDQNLEKFDTNFKVLPPLREENTRNALVNAVLDNTIDCITSDHLPLDVELKKIEFDHASFGTIGLETVFGALSSLLPVETIVEKLTAARTIFNLENNDIAVGKKSNLTLFTTDGEKILKEDDLLSTSKNCAFIGTKLKGKIFGTINNNQLILN